MVANIPSAIVLRMIIWQHFTQEIPALYAIPFVDYLAVILIFDLLRPVRTENLNKPLDEAIITLVYEAAKVLMMLVAALILGQFV